MEINIKVNLQDSEDNRAAEIYSEQALRDEIASWFSDLGIPVAKITVSSPLLRDTL